MSDELAEFILARIAEVEQMAREAGGGTWRLDCHHSPPFPPIHYDDCCGVVGADIRIYGEGGHGTEQAVHIAYWDPARVLAKCRADRLIVERCQFWSDYADYAQRLAYDVLVTLASEYDAHPDYRPEWAVS